MLTMEDTKGWKVRQGDHYNGGATWFGYGGSCIQQPRLYKLTRHLKKTRATEVEWSVDGQKCASLEEAVDRLNRPPEINLVEREVLSKLPDEWSARAVLKEMLGEGWYEAIFLLRRKALIEAHEGAFRRTELARELLAVPLDGRLEEQCPGHIGRDDDLKRCKHCGVRVDELRPSEEGEA